VGIVVCCNCVEVNSNSFCYNYLVVDHATTAVLTIVAFEKINYAAIAGATADFAAVLEEYFFGA